MPGGNLQLLAIRATGTGDFTLFDPDRLRSDVENGVLKRMPEHRIDEAVKGALSVLERKVAGLATPLSDDQLRVFPHAKRWIWDEIITETVEDQLGPHNRMALVLYALSIRGRRDTKGRPGWKTAADVLNWANKRFERLALDLAIPPTLEPEWWHRPAVDAPRPQWVIKRSHNDEVRNGTRRFEYDQFVKSIFLALSGRPNRRVNSQLIAEWVLWGLAGQQFVLSSQLAVGVLDCLRRIDDIAYLRWAVIAKGIQSVAEFVAEAQALIVYPAPRLRFRGEEVAAVRAVNARSRERADVELPRVRSDDERPS